MTSGETCSNCGQELRGDSNYCGVCGTPSRPRDEASQPGRVEIGSEDDPWGDRRIDAEDRSRQAESLEDDRLASMGTRTGSFLINGLVPNLLGFIPILGIIIWFAWEGFTLSKMRRGQDIGASITKIRVVRNNGEVAGFYHMWTRNLAALISTIVFGAGYWTAYFDEGNRTWHDKIMKTYVIWDNPDAALRPGTSSNAAVIWFWISAVLIVVGVAALAVALIAAI